MRMPRFEDGSSVLSAEKPEKVLFECKNLQISEMEMNIDGNAYKEKHV